MDILMEALDRLNIRYTDDMIPAFSTYLRMLKKWSRAYNLTSIRGDAEIVLKHFVDSLSYLKALPEDAVTLLDVGTGAGFPGVPMKIVRPPLKVYLLEPSRKKTVFLKNLIHALSLTDIHIIRCRIEDYPCSYTDAPETFDAVVTRALFKADEFIRMTSHLCGDNGLMVISKGPAYREEITTIKKPGYRIIRPDLSIFGLERYLIVIKA